MGRAKSLGKIDGKVLLKSQNETSPQANNEKNNLAMSKLALSKKNDSPPKSSSDVRTMKKQKTEKVMLQMSQTVTDRSPKSAKRKSESQTPRKPTNLIQPFPIPPEKNANEKDIRPENSSVNNNKPSQYKTPERRPKEAAAQLEGQEEVLSERNSGGEKSPSKFNHSVTSINFQKWALLTSENITRVSLQQVEICQMETRKIKKSY